eukprot:TRINITY_DN6098_c0_g4_i1.p1 TRINITY_DN6098_c0_g4~~TRINITY_DN6098_c0_g4_i1.p1  ORF type:complete len:188 (+),score=24.18 TRINITY_DN6098_c0_g4_i1:261-824(+)
MSCYEDRLIMKNECLLQCPKGTYPNVEHRMCEPCVAGCSDCVSLTECVYCDKGLYLNIDICVYAPDCPPGTYAENKTRVCEKCHGKCLTCVGLDSNHCTNCTEGHMEILGSYGKCKTLVCSEGQYLNLTRCESCNGSCAVCNSSEHCAQCKRGLLSVLVDNATLVCQECPRGYEATPDMQCKGREYH